MIRRDFCKASLGMAGLALTGRVALAGTGAQAAPGAPAPVAPAAPGLTRYVSEFIVNTRYEDLPPEVLELARKSILDGFGLALAGSVSEHRHAVLEYLHELGSNGQASVVGTDRKSAARFAAFANGVWIHASVSVRRVSGAVSLVFQDDGIGLPDGFDAAKCTSMGLKLAASLAHQLGGTVIFSSERGCRAEALLTRH